MASSSSSTLGFILLLPLFVSLLVGSNAQEHKQFLFEGFNDSEKLLNREGATVVKPSGSLKLTNRSYNVVGHAFFYKPFQMLNTSNTTKPKFSSFSTSFVFSIVPSTSGPGGFGLAFVIAPSTQFPWASPGHLLGLVNSSNDGNSSNHLFVVEFDTVNGYGSQADSKGNHVGVNINGMNSIVNEPAAYFKEGTGAQKEDFSMEESDAVQAWIDYDGDKKIVNVTVAPISLPAKPSKPLISHLIDLQDVLNETMFVGFSASTGERKASSHYILGWGFSMNGPSPSLNSSKLPQPPAKENNDPSSSSFPWVKLAIGVLSAIIIVLLVCLCSLTLYRRYANNFETLEHWELDCPHRFRYRDLHIATKGFKESELIGIGGFGAVYKGALPSTGTEVAVKRIVRGPIQGMREFAAEIESLGRLRHKNLVNLQGWCKRKNDLVLVYDYISNGSLDSLLFDPSIVLSWEQRFNIIKGVANGLLYLHEEWEQVVIHRDIKTGNILIDEDLNARVGDFGLARLYDHGEVSHTTNVVGTIGYIAPELTRTGKASTSSDVYAYGVLLLEVVSGRRPIESGQFFLLDWVVENQSLVQILEVVDPKLNSVYDEDEAELVLKLGLLCTQHRPDLRPTMRQVTRYLNFDDPIPIIGDWRGEINSGSSGLSSGFLEIVSANTISSTAYNLSSINSMSSKRIEDGR